MFAVTFSSSKKKLIITGLVLFVAFVLVFVSFIMRTDDTAVCESGQEYSVMLDDIDDVSAFSAQFEYDTQPLLYQRKVTIPSQFNGTYEDYNNLQLHQGLDLYRYRGKECLLCVYKIEHSDDYLSLLVYDNKVIGGHTGSFEYNSDIKDFFGESI